MVFSSDGLFPSGELFRGRYRNLEIVDSGGFGTVYRAEDTQFSPYEIRAIKRINLNPGDRNISREELRNKVNKEVEALERLKEHFNRINSNANLPIPKLIEFFEDNGYFYIVQEFIEGKLLSDRLKPGICFVSGSQASVDRQVRTFLIKLLKVLKEIHKTGWVHRDLKPDNIFLRDGNPVLFDFGVVKETASSVDISTDYNTYIITRVMGAYPYIAPERRNNSQQDINIHNHPRLDIYSVGVIAKQALTGKVPEAALFDSLNGVEDKVLRNVVNRMTSPAINIRYSSVEEVLKELNEIDPPPPPINWTRWIVAGTSVVTAALLSLIIIPPIVRPPTDTNPPEPRQPEAKDHANTNPAPASVGTDETNQAKLPENRLVSIRNERETLENRLENIQQNNSQQEDKIRGIELYLEGLALKEKASPEAKSKFNEAAAAFEASWLNEKKYSRLKDPETLIYWLNALLEATTDGNYSTIALSVPLSSQDENGNAESAGEAILRGVSLRQTKVNVPVLNKLDRNIGLPSVEAINPDASKGLKILIFDDKNTTSEAARVADRITKNPEVTAVIGPYASDTTTKVLPIYQKAGLPVVSPGATTFSLENEEYFFRTVSNTEIQAGKIIAYLEKLGSLKDKKIRVYYNNNSEFTQSFYQEFEREFKTILESKFGIESSSVLEKYTYLGQDEFDIEAAIAGLDSNTIVILYPDGNVTTGAIDDAIQIIEEIEKIDDSILVIGAWTLQDEKVYNLSNKALENFKILTFWQRDNQGYQNKSFIKESDMLWGSDVNPLTATSYDAALAVSESLRFLYDGRDSDLENSREEVKSILESQTFYGGAVSDKIDFSNPENPTVFLKVDKDRRRFIPIEEAN